MTWVDGINKTPEDKRLFAQEQAILEVTELVCKLMEEQGVSKDELAKRMRTTKGKIIKLLDGRLNPTLLEISDLLFHLNHRFRLKEK